jgi:hypothetical protein
MILAASYQINWPTIFVNRHWAPADYQGHFAA